MADIIEFPSGLTTPVPAPPRHRGRYASKKIIPAGRLKQMRNAKWEQEQEAARDAAWHASEEKYREDAQTYFRKATEMAPLKMAGLLERLTLGQQVNLLLQRSCEFQYLASYVLGKVTRLEELVDELTGAE